MVTVIVNSLFTSTTNIIVPDGSQSAWIVDCGDEDKIIDFLRIGDLTLEGVFLTHGHFDHIYGINAIIRKFPEIKVYTSEYGASMICDSRRNMSHYWGHPLTYSYPKNIIVVKDGDEIDLGNNLRAKAFFTPGHNPSCITWLIGDALFTGDSYIPGIKTVTNLPGGNKIQAEESITLIKKLSTDKFIYPGHVI